MLSASAPQSPSWIIFNTIFTFKNIS
jgi:hypothetical protein